MGAMPSELDAVYSAWITAKPGKAGRLTEIVECVGTSPHRRREDRLKLGLLGLRERVEILGGGIEISTQPGKGTRLFVQLPAKKA